MNGMILAAGLGKRLRPLTDRYPKPMMEMGGRPLIDQTLLQMARLDLEQVVVNVHYLADQIVDHVGDGNLFGVRVVWSREDTLLDTGGGVCKALPLLGQVPFLAINGDVAWRMDLRPLIDAFDAERMDGLLGLVPVVDGGPGDFCIDGESGRLRRADGGERGWIYSGIQILRPEALSIYPVYPFSLNRFYDDAIDGGRLFGLPLAGFWADIGTVERLSAAQMAWKNRFAIGDGLAYKDLGFTDRL